MTNATQPTRPVNPADQLLCAVFPKWCGWPEDDHTEHYGELEASPAIATAGRDQIRETDAGVLVAQVRVSICADRTYNEKAEPHIAVEVLRPNGKGAEVRMSLAESDVLSSHIRRCVIAARSEVAS